MATATFYLISENSPQASQSGWFDYVVYLSRHFVHQGAKLYLHCHDQAQAEALAEVFFQIDGEAYLAHHLAGEGPKYGTAIEIGHPQTKPLWNRQLLINLANQQTTFAHKFAEVVDFVPCEEKAKQLARERYKLYRQAGFAMQTVEISLP